MKQQNNDNIMRNIEIDSVTLHCSSADSNKLERSEKLLKFISKEKPIKTTTTKRIPTWKVRPGMELGVKVTLRKKKAIEVLKTIFSGIQTFRESQFAGGIFAFGVKEYIEINAIPYQRDVGIIGFEAMIALKRKGKRISKRRISRARIPQRHRITKEETIEFFKKNFNLNITKNKKKGEE
jgi:large subunit ribosomal protein L5